MNLEKSRQASFGWSRFKTIPKWFLCVWVWIWRDGSYGTSHQIGDFDKEKKIWELESIHMKYSANIFNWTILSGEFEFP